MPQVAPRGPIGYESYDYPGDAATALDRLDAIYAAWMTGVRALGPEDLSRPCGPAEGPWGNEPMAALVVHINREMLHHGAEIAPPRPVPLAGLLIGLD